MLNIALLLIIVLIILSVAAVNIIGFEVPYVYGTFGLGMPVLWYVAQAIEYQQWAIVCARRMLD